MAKTLKRVVVAAVILLSVIVLAAAIYYYHGWSTQPVTAPGAEPDLVDQLPPGAAAVIHINLAAVRATPFAKRLEALLPPPVPDPEYKKFVRETGFDYEKDLDRVAIALWPSSGKGVDDGASLPQIVALAEGRFDHGKIAAYASRAGKIEHRQGTDVYEIPASGGGRISLAFLAAARIALAENADITPLLTPATAPRLDSDMREQIQRVAGGDFFAVARTADLPHDLGLDFSHQQQLSRLLKSIHTLSLAGRPDGEKYLVAAEAGCDSTVNALELATLLDTLRLVGRAALADPRTRQQIEAQALPVLETLLRVAEISHDGNSVRLRLGLTPEMLGGPPDKQANPSSSKPSPLGG